MPSFSDDDLQLIQEQSKPDNQLPQFFDSVTLQNITISRAFEAYLILQTQAQKQATLQWIRQSLAFQEDRLDRDAILTRYLANRATDATAKMADVQTRVNNFNSFRSGLLISSDPGGGGNIDWSSVVEVDQLADSLQSPLDEIVFLYEQALHENNLVKVLQARLTSQAYTANNKKELQSWQTVISAYPGQAGGTPAPTSSLGVPIVT